jgi:hypothetical protein
MPARRKEERAEAKVPRAEGKAEKVAAPVLGRKAESSDSAAAQVKRP